jgi:DNA-binding NarL/FixJ family response regulator
VIKPPVGHERLNPAGGTVTTVALALSSRLLARGVRSALHATNDIHVVAEAYEITEALHAVHKYGPKVLLLDIDLSGGGGGVLLRRLHQHGLSTNIVFVLHCRRGTGLTELEEKASVFITWLDNEEEVIKAVRAAVAGTVHISDSARYLQKSIPSPASVTEQSNENELTATESQVLGHLGHGRTSRQIAELMFISYRTVQKHRANIARKLGMRGSNALLAYALKRSMGD